MGRGAVSGTWGQLGVPQEGGVDRTAEHYRRESWEGDVPERIEPKARERTRGLAPTSLPTFPQWSLSCQLGNAEGSAKPKTGGGGARGVTGAVCWDCFARRAPPPRFRMGRNRAAEVSAAAQDGKLDWGISKVRGGRSETQLSSE